MTLAKGADKTGEPIAMAVLPDRRVLLVRQYRHAAGEALLELPAYEPSGEGDHVFVRIEKRGLATMQAIEPTSTGLAISQV